MCNIPAKKLIVGSVDEFSMQNMYSCFIPYSYRSMTSIQHTNSFFIYYALKFESQFFGWVFHAKDIYIRLVLGIFQLVFWRFVRFELKFICGRLRLCLLSNPSDNDNDNGDRGKKLYMSSRTAFYPRRPAMLYCMGYWLRDSISITWLVEISILIWKHNKNRFREEDLKF